MIHPTLLHLMTSEADMNEREQEAAVKEILAERARQHALALGGDTASNDRANSRNDWVAAAAAYLGRASAKVFRNERDGCRFRENMVKAAAVILAALEAEGSGWLDGGKVDGA